MTAATSIAQKATQADASLDGARFIALTTFRRSGAPVSTPVLFVADGDRLLVRTARDTGKLKRIRHTPTVHVAPSDSRGRPLGPAVAGHAHILGPQAVTPTLERLHGKHRIVGPVFSAIRRLRGQQDVIVAIVPDRSAQ